MKYRNAIFISLALFMGLAQSQSYDFIKVDPTEADSKGNSIATNCEQDYPDATASMEVNQGLESTDVTINVAGAQPDTLFTVWVWLKGTDAQGNTFGGNPLSGKSGAPLAPSSAFTELRACYG